MAAATQTPVDLCNLALLYTGQGQQINTLEQATMEAKACKRYYAPTRDAFLESFWWKFATKHANLVLLSGIDNPDWQYAYALPTDYITARFIHTGLRIPNPIDKIPFEVETTSSNLNVVSGLCLMTDQKLARLAYTAECPVLALWSPLAIEAFAWALAVKLCLILPVKPDWAAKAKVEARATWLTAGAAQNRSAQQDPPPPSEYTSKR